MITISLEGVNAPIIYSVILTEFTKYIRNNYRRKFRHSLGFILKLIHSSISIMCSVG